MTYYREATVHTQELLDLLVKCENKIQTVSPAWPLFLLEGGESHCEWQVLPFCWAHKEAGVVSAHHLSPACCLLLCSASRLASTPRCPRASRPWCSTAPRWVCVARCLFLHCSVLAAPCACLLFPSLPLTVRLFPSTFPLRRRLAAWACCPWATSSSPSLICATASRPTWVSPTSARVRSAGTERALQLGWQGRIRVQKVKEYKLPPLLTSCCAMPR